MAELVYPPVLGLARGFFAALDLKITVDDAHHIPTTGGAVIAINHVSYLDFIFAGLTARYIKPKRVIRFMAKESVFRHKVSGPLMRGMHHIPVDRAAGADAYRAAVQALKDGELVGVFPEATISQSFELKGFKAGAARMAQEAGVPIVPVVIWGSQRLMTKGKPRNLKRNGIAIIAKVGAPLAIEADDDIQVATEVLKKQMNGLLVAARETYPQSPKDDSDRWWLPASMGGTAPPLPVA